MLCWLLVLCTILCRVVSSHGSHVAIRRSDDSESPSSNAFRAVGLALGTGPSTNITSFKEFELNPATPCATIDYGTEVGGYPYLNVRSFIGKVQIEIKYSEPFAGLNAPMSDGPFPFAAGISNTFRVETFEIDSLGFIYSPLIQGGLRWQSLRLLTNGAVNLSMVGLKASFPTTNVDSFPGRFTSDDDSLNRVWKLGAKAAEAACVEAGSQGAAWEISATDGAYVTNMRPVSTYKSAYFANYTLEFSVRIKRGGAGWVMACGLTSVAGGIQLNLVGELPSGSTFVNTNTSLTPPNSIMLGYGYSFVNQTSLTSYYLDTFAVPFPIHEDTWYTIESAISEAGYLSVSIDKRQIFKISLASYYVGSSTIPTSGSFGFGAWQDQAAFFKDARAYDTTSGALLYNNTLTDASVLSEYGVHSNNRSVCLDGPKRDRLVWLGDFINTGRSIAVSTSRLDIVKSTLQFLLEWQSPLGLLPFAAPMGYDPAETSQTFALIDGVVEIYGQALTDYQILGLISFCDYVKSSNDLTFAASTWAKWELQTTWLLSNINATTGLLALPGFTFLDSARAQGSAASCAFLEALSKLADVATAINMAASAVQYQNAATSLSDSINMHLWNARGGFYALSPAYPNDYSTAGLGLCLSSGAANTTQATYALSALSALHLKPGYKDSTLVNSSDPSVVISPFTNGFLLSALLSQGTAGSTSLAKSLLETLWRAMIRDDATSTGASWEYVDQDGQPGLGLFTSLSHPWGGAPTYLLTEFVAGLQQASGVDGFGYRNWVVSPITGVQLGLKRVSAKVLTAFGGSLEVKWEICDGKMSILVKAPRGTRGVFDLGRTRKELSGKTRYTFEVML